MRNILLFSLCTLFLSVTAHAAASKGQSLDRIVAIVNDAPIMQSELSTSMNEVKRQISGSGASMPPEDAMRKHILQQLVDRKLQLQLAEQAGIKVTDDQINKAVAHIAENNKMNSDQVYEQVKQQGLTVEGYRKELNDEITIQELQQQQAGAKISVTAQEVKDFIRSKPWQAANNKEYHIEDILIALPDEPTTQQIQEAKKHAEALVQKIHQGTNFNTVAMSDSAGDKALKGGDLGWRKLPEVPSAFAKDIMNMQNNEIAGPIQTSNGFHIIHLSGIRSTGTVDTSNKQVEQLIYQRKMEEAIQTWLAKVRSQAFIDMNPET